MKNARDIAAFLLLATFIASFLPSCTERPEVELTYRMRRQIDTLAKEQRLALAPLYDSMCVAMTDSLIRSAYDSIMAERLRQMQKIRSEQ